MPPDYQSKKNTGESAGDQSAKRLESLEEKLYENKGEGRLDLGELRTSFSGSRNVPVRTEWSENDLPKERGAEPVSTRNTFAFLKQILIG